MGVMPDRWIAEMARKHGMIRPFAANRTRSGRISYGVSSYGYDFRLSREFKIPALGTAKRWDPKKMGQAPWIDHNSSSCWIASNSYVLGRSLEYFRIPRDILVICQGKSTYARCGLIVNVTPFEPEWEGFVTVSLVNAAPIPVRVFAGEGIAQLVFLKAESECETSYADRKGKYQAQKKIQIARL
ncbi:MAG: dCTP deaminase [Acidobacteriia bacterium]|nr:dCTP deaminase [Terriglobia bacterium]